MASRKVKLRIETELQKKALDDAVKGIRKVEGAVEKSGKTSAKMSKQGAKAAKANSWAMGQAAMQLQDVSVQAQMGTDSMRILGQQGPQLLSAFGPTGMLAGLAVAVGAGLVSAFRKPKEEIGELMEEMDALGSQVKEISDVRFQSMEDSLKSIIKSAKDAAAAFEELSASRSESDNRAIEAKDALIRAEIEHNKLQGIDQKMAEQKLAAAIAQRKIIEERNALNDALAKKRYDELQAVERIKKEQEILNDRIKTQRFLIEQTEAKREPLFEAYEERQAAEGERAWSPVGGMEPTTAQAKKTKEAWDLIQTTNMELDAQRGVLEGLSREYGNLTQSLKFAERQAAQTEETLTDDLEKIDLQSKAKAVGTSMANMGAQLETVAVDVNEAADVLGGKAPGEVMARLKALLEDGIQTQELEEITRLLQQMGTNVGVAYGKQNTTLRDVITELERLSNQADQNQRSLKTLQSRSTTKVK